MNLRILFSLTLLATAFAGWAEEPINASRFSSVAIEGYDTVAYFTQSKPVKGEKAYETEWEGAKWRFASQENLDKFKADPAKYAPQYGGYCAWAMSQGKFAGIDPEAWKIIDGKLYLNYSKKIQAKWEQDIPGHIAAADEKYPELIAQ